MHTQTRDLLEKGLGNHIGLAFSLPKVHLASFAHGVAQRDAVELRLNEATEHYLHHIHLENTF